MTQHITKVQYLVRRKKKGSDPVCKKTVFKLKKKNTLGMGVDKMGEGSQEAQTSIYIILKSQGCHAQHGD